MDVLSRFLEVEKELYTKHSAIKKNGINHILKILERMGNPQKRIGKIIHITGTNGKGSVAYLTAAFLKRLGYKVGLYTSPHVRCLNERIKINFNDISHEDFLRLYEYVLSFERNLSFFEIITLIMINYFQENNVDFSVIEVGIGGLYDTTNVVDGTLCLITSVDYDHTDILGPTLNDIAFQKAGIIKENSICVVGDVAAEQFSIISSVAHKKNASLIKADDLFEVIGIEEDKMLIQNRNSKKVFRSSLIGVKQTLNISMVLTGLKALGIEVDELMFEDIISNIPIEGRFQIIKKVIDDKIKTFIVDGAHNPAAIKVFLENIRCFGFDKKNPHLIFSMLSTKDYVTSIKEIVDSSIFNYITITSIENPKKLSPYTIAQTIERFSSKIDLTIIDDIKIAIFHSLKSDFICILGSFYLASDALRVLREDL